MPQFDTSTFLSQIVWLIICFGTVVFCYVRIFVPKFNQTIDNRISKIRHDIEQAEWMNEQGRLLLENNQRKIEEAQKQVQEHIKNTLANLDLKKKTQLAHIDAEHAISLKAIEKSFEHQQISLQSSMESIAAGCVNDILHHVIHKSSSYNTISETTAGDNGGVHGTH
jgi:F-type H+-transporting ATPase subunit b